MTYGRVGWPSLAVLTNNICLSIFWVKHIITPKTLPPAIDAGKLSAVDGYGLKYDKYGDMYLKIKENFIELKPIGDDLTERKYFHIQNTNNDRFYIIREKNGNFYSDNSVVNVEVGTNSV